jgi:UDP-N-acetylmuramyl pentapeptide phosphotransferase/UDP-N-acetylglucosamine-1-phosphate transferase
MPDRMNISELPLTVFAIVTSGVLSTGITWTIHPWLLHHALSRPSARSSHRVPTPQGAGIAVIAATLIVMGIIEAYSDTAPNMPAAIFAASLFIAILGFADDISSIPVLPRLVSRIAKREQFGRRIACIFISAQPITALLSCASWVRSSRSTSAWRSSRSHQPGRDQSEATSCS